MIFTFDLRRALKGDCFLVHYGTRAQPGLIVVDGGPSDVYRPHLRPRLEEIRRARQLGADASLPIDVLMVSHVDDDHIRGVLELTAELVEAKDASRPLPFRIRSFWHNTFDDIIGNSPGELLAAVQASFGSASLAGEPDVEGLDPHGAKVLASVSQGVRLRDDARKLRLRLNPQFGGRLVMAGDTPTRLDMTKGLSLTMVGPAKAELLALQKAHDTFLRDREEGPASLAAFSDTSVPNLSSIVVLAEAQGKRMLLTGDARGDKVLKGLEAAGLLVPGGTMHVDVLKMPHHGSDRNMAPEFLARVRADHYVFSGDGEHGNPERATIEMLRDARPEGDFQMHLTYPVDHLDRLRKEDWDVEQKKERVRKARNPRVKVREDWSPAAHSLQALLDAHPALAATVRVVPDSGAHLIELLDPVGM